MFLLVFLFLPLISGCTVGPSYHRPEVTIPVTYKEIPPGWKIAQPADTIDRGLWWTVYDDAVLNTLIDKLNNSNQTIAQYAAAYRFARAQVNETRAGYWPTLSASAGAGRTSAGPSIPRHDNNIKFDASWELDLWGKVDNMVHAKQADEAAAAADLANARLSAQALLAQTYFQVRMRDAVQKILDDAVLLSQKLLQLTETQCHYGAVDYADVSLAQTQLQQAQLAAIDNGIKRAHDEHAIATLIGETASTFSLPSQPPIVQLPPQPLDVPSVLLERRPDVAAAERRVAAANAQIGVAVAALFPTLSLSATGGFQSSMWSQLLTLPSRFWGVGSQLGATLFDRGASAARRDVARATYDQEVARYRAIVLVAFQDVEDNLASQRILEQEMGLQQQVIESAERALAITMLQFKAGRGNYLKVLNAQTTLLAARQRATEIVGQQMLSSVSLVKTLGGSFVE
jgi:NodT family efflux transporter outer membrane factor (OMF) lipoprotein